MKPVLAAAVALVALTPRAGGTQSAQDPSLVLSIQLGFTTGSELWRIDRQEALVIGSAQTDTVAVARRLRTGLTAVLSGLYFRSPHLGYTFEAGFFGIGSESRCQPIGTFKPQADNINQQACTVAQGRHLPTSAVAFQGGLAYRFRLRRAAPYVRASAGLALLGSSFVETSGTVATSACPNNQLTCPWFFVDEARRNDDGSVEQHRREFSLAGSVAAGAVLEASPGYRFRIEVRDFIIGLPTPTAPASTSGTLLIAPLKTTVKHVPTISVGLDVVLERRRARRY